ncbi:MAG TPA: HEAT repeat domain-containing protein [Candidatus Acidoferrales bacterium]|nr:HEAT repeat domain-containing protein [Candidatus Acidoferrales bacterium]
MESIFEKLWRLGPAALVLKAIVVALVANGLLLGFILLRRTYRKWYFAKRDARVFELRKDWDRLISGEIPYETWRQKSFDRRIVESIALDAFEAAGAEESARLLKFLRDSGLIEKRIFEARTLTGWRRMRALVALGQTRALEGISAMAEGLRDGNLEIRMAALRGLGRTAAPQAAEAILAWVGERGLCVPAMPLQNALIQCCAERPQLLIPYVQHAVGPLREVLGRVLGEVATPSLSLDLLQFVGDELDELRAAAARAMSHADRGLAFDVLSELVGDPIWFVRLRAIISLGELCEPRAIPDLIRGLTDSNRLVRLRAAEALVKLKTEMAPIFQQVIATQDRYGLQAYLTALENAGLRGKLEEELQASTVGNDEEKTRLWKILQTGVLLAEETVLAESGPAKSAFLS